MKWMSAYLVGYVLLLLGVGAALYKTGVLANVSGEWIAIAVAILTGLGIMISVANSGRKETIQIEK